MKVNKGMISLLKRTTRLENKILWVSGQHGFFISWNGESIITESF